MQLDMETDDDVIELIPGQKIKADHIYINDVDIDTLTETVNRKLDKIIEALADDNAIQEDEPLGI